MEERNRAWAEIDLDALKHNLREIKKCIKKGTRMMAVVKADAYGHGVFEVAKTAIENGADYLGVAWVCEAVELRELGINVPIMVLGNSAYSEIEEIVKYDITATVSDVGFAEKLSSAAKKLNKTAKIHIKIDTGMSRIGFLSDTEERKKDTCSEILKISKLTGLEIEGIFSHFASADDEDYDYTYMQYNRFLAVAKELDEEGIRIPIKHICNSAAAAKFPEMHLDMVRLGIMMYGLYPSKGFDKRLLDLIPVMSFKARITAIKELDEGVSLSYGRTYCTEGKSKIATVSVGYADGYPRALSNFAEMMAGGKRAKQVGRICMDQCMIDVSKVNNINVGDEVTLFGKASENGVSADCLADALGTINYEIVCNVARRVPRVYIKDGMVVKSLNYILREYGM